MKLEVTRALEPNTERAAFVLVKANAGEQILAFFLSPSEVDDLVEKLKSIAAAETAQ